jgi:hypothetical protein
VSALFRDRVVTEAYIVSYVAGTFMRTGKSVAAWNEEKFALIGTLYKEYSLHAFREWFLLLLRELSYVLR